VDVFRDYFTVYLIPHTLNNTILGKKSLGKKVNIEFDILAKYALNLKDTTIL
jgi:riboflavin synthase